MIYSKKIKLKEYVFKNKKSFIDFLQKLNSYIDDVHIQYKIELITSEYSMSFDSFETLIETINESDVVYYLNISSTLDNSQIFNKIEFIYHNINNFKLKTSIKLYSSNTNWIAATEKDILESLEGKKNKLRYLKNDFISIFLLTIILTFILFINPNFTINFNDMSHLLSFFIFYGITFFLYEIVIMLATPTFKVKWDLPLNPIKRYVYDKIADNIINYIISAIIGGIFSLIIAKLFL